MVDGWPTLMWVLVEVRPADNSAEPTLYQVPLGASLEEPVHLPAPAILGRIDTDGPGVWLFDALADNQASAMFIASTMPDVEFKQIRPQDGEQSNTSLILDERYILKVFRRVQVGANPDVEITEALGRVGFGRVPVPVAMWRKNGTDLAVVRRYERSRGDGFELATASLREMFNRRRPPRDCKLDFAAEARLLGRDIASLHVALAEAFGAEPADGAQWAADMVAQLHRVAGGHLDSVHIERVYGRLAASEDLGSAIRIHGDLHLGQVLRLQRDWMVLDFEGEPARPIEERRRPSSPLRDVAGMTRSFHYAAGMALREQPTGDPDLKLLSGSWAVRNVNSFLAGYADVDEAHRLLPRARSSRDALLSVFELDKAVYEVAYELSYRPELADLPIQAVERLLDGEESLPDGPADDERAAGYPAEGHVGI